MKTKSAKTFCKYVFGRQELSSPEAISQFAQETLSKIDNHLENIDIKPSLLDSLDNISYSICDSAEPMYALYLLHSNPPVKQAAATGYTSIINRMDMLNKDNMLYNAVLELYFSPLAVSGMFNNTSYSKLLQTAVEDLSEANQSESSSSESNLATELSSATSLSLKMPINKEQINKNDSQFIKTFLTILLDNSKKDYITADLFIIKNILTNCSSAEMRETAFSLLKQHCSSYLPKVESLLNERLIKANSMGYPSYFSYMNRHYPEYSADKLRTALHQLLEDIQLNLLMEVQLLQAHKPEMFSSLNYRDSKYLLSSFTEKLVSGVDHKRKKFITPHNILMGLAILVKNLFDKNFVPILVEEDMDEEQIHPSVLLCKVFDNDGKLESKIYFDIFKRENKELTATSHLTVRGFKAAVDEVPVSLIQSSIEVTDQNLLHMPISFNDAKDIFHEFGHALQNILSREQFQYLSGTRVPLIFAEIPSHFFENFLLDYNFAKLWMKSKEESISQELFNAMISREALFPNILFEETVLNALIDLELHSFTESKTEEEIKQKVSEIYGLSVFNRYDWDKPVVETVKGVLENQSQMDLKTGLDNLIEFILGGERKNDSLRDQISKLLKGFHKEIKDDECTWLLNQPFNQYPAQYYSYVIGKSVANLLTVETVSKHGYPKVGSTLERNYLSRGNSEDARDMLREVLADLNKV